MIRQLLGERPRLPNKPAAALAERVGESFKQARLPGCFTTRVVARGGKDRRIRTPEIGVTDGTLAVHGWERLPQTTRTAFVARADKAADNQARFAIKGEPDPLLVRLRANTGPPFVTVDGQPPVFWSGHRPDGAAPGISGSRNTGANAEKHR
jgi:hypothetical protein